MFESGLGGPEAGICVERIPTQHSKPASLAQPAQPARQPAQPPSTLPPVPRPPQGGECFLRELRCKKEMAKNGGVPTQIRTGSFYSGFIGIIYLHVYMHIYSVFSKNNGKKSIWLHSHRETYLLGQKDTRPHLHVYIGFYSVFVDMHLSSKSLFCSSLGFHHQTHLPGQ